MIIARSTVYAVLRRAAIHRLAWLHRTTREIVRYEHARPGALVHLDIKKLGRIPQGGGKRILPGFAETRSGPRHSPRLGFDFLHVAVDDHSRSAYVEPPAEGTSGRRRLPLASSQLIGPGGGFERHGIGVERIVERQRRLPSRAAPAQAPLGGTGRAAETRNRRATSGLGPAGQHLRRSPRSAPGHEWAYKRAVITPTASDSTRCPCWVVYHHQHSPHGGIGGATPASRLSTTSYGNYS